MKISFINFSKKYSQAWMYLLLPTPFINYWSRLIEPENSSKAYLSVASWSE